MYYVFAYVMEPLFFFSCSSNKMRLFIIVTATCHLCYMKMLGDRHLINNVYLPSLHPKAVIFTLRLM